MARQSIWCTLKSITFSAWYIGEQSFCGLFKNASIRTVSIPTFTVLETTWPKQPKCFQYIDQMSGAFESANVVRKLPIEYVRQYDTSDIMESLGNWNWQMQKKNDGQQNGVASLTTKNSFCSFCCNLDNFRYFR